MAQYKTHLKFNLMIVYPFFLAGLYLFFHVNYAYIILFSLAFIYDSLFMNPDMDLAKKIKLFSLKGLFTFPFRSYSYVFHHRGWSHKPFIGSFTRIVWLLGFFLVLFSIFHWEIPSYHFIQMHQNEIFFACMGIVAADIAHLILD